MKAVSEITQLATVHMCIQYNSYIIKYLNTAYHIQFLKQITQISHSRSGL